MGGDRIISYYYAKKKPKKMYLSIIRYVVVCSCRYNFEGLSCTYRRRVIRCARWARGKFKGTRRLIVDFTGKAGITMLMGGIFVTPIQIFEFPLLRHQSDPEFCDESVSCCYVFSLSIVSEVLYAYRCFLCIGRKKLVVIVSALYQIRRGQRFNTRKLWSITLLNG